MGYPEIQMYFNDLIQSIWRGGFEWDYHPGQNYDEDTRGYNPDNILRPYLNEEARQDYQERTLTTTHSAYDYDNFILSWNSETAIDEVTGFVDNSGHTGLEPPTNGPP